MGGRHIYRMFERVGLVGFELEEGITTVFNHQREYALRWILPGEVVIGGIEHDASIFRGIIDHCGA